MARKKSERYRDLAAPHLRVRDGRRILGNLAMFYPLWRSGGAVVPEPSKPRFALLVDNTFTVSDVSDPGNARFLTELEIQKRERRPRTITQDGEYIRFPDFVIRAEKLLPTVRKAIEGGLREIEYSSLRRLLGM